MYMITFMVKDDSTASLDKCYKIYLYSYNVLGDEFFGGFKPTNLYRNIDVREQLERYLKMMSQFNVYLDIVIKKRFADSIKEEVYEIYDGRLISI